jgi:ABC-2 type transport system permease protein
MSKYAGMYSSGQSMNNLMADLPKSLQAMFGVGGLDLSKVSGYYGILFIYLLVMATIHAAMLGSSILSKEERDKTSEFLMVKPVSRNQVLSAKLCAALMNVIIFNVVMLASSIGLVNPYAKGENVIPDILLLMGGMFILQLLFLMLGMAIAAISKHPKRAVSLSTGILLATFILSMMIDISGQIDALKYVTPFKYFEAKQVMYGGGYDPVFVILSVVIIAVSLFATYYFYNKRDLTV